MARCRYCRQTYERKRMTQKCCESVECAIKAGQARKAKEAAKKAKADRAEFRARKEKIKTRRDYINEAQAAFNKFIRVRDSGKPCICCGKAIPLAETGGSGDAGHYRSVGSAPHLRFDERNCHLQDKQCNRWGSGRAVDYRIGLIQRIGLQAVEALEADQEPRKWSIEELRAIRDTYRAKLKELNEAKVWHNHPQETAGHLEGE
ncbi:MAG: recombination protein NinG [Candidatus Methylomirabilota bacterium]